MTDLIKKVMAIIPNALTILDFFLRSFDWWKKTRDIIVEGAAQAIVLAELVHEHEKSSGAIKKKEAAEALSIYLHERGAFTIIPQGILAWILDIGMTAIVSALNEKYGHDWLEKLR